MGTCLYCECNYADTFFHFNKYVCDNCSARTHGERINNRLNMWQKKYPPGTDFTGEGHISPPIWVYDFWRQCNFTDEQLLKVEPTLGNHTLSMGWQIIDGEYVNWKTAREYKNDETSDHPQSWHYSLELGDEDGEIDYPVAYFWCCNTIGIPVRHWEPSEDGPYINDGVPGDYVDHPQPAWAVSEGVLLGYPTVEQVHQFVDTGEIPTARSEQEIWER